MPGCRTEPGDKLDAELRQAAARRRLALRRERILIVDAALAGRSQTRIAHLSGVSQAHVSRILAKVKRDNGGKLRHLQLSALDVIDAREAGEIDSSLMMEQLSNTAYTDGIVAHVNGIPTDAYVRGSWDDIEQAFQEDRLTFDEYSALFTAHRSRAKPQPAHDRDEVTETKQ